MRMARLALLLFVCPALFAQTGTAAATGCPVGMDFEAAGFTIRSAQVKSPFEFLPWISASVEQARSQVARLQGAPYKNQDVKNMEETVFKTVALPDTASQPVIFDLIVTYLENCSTNQVDLTYWVLTSQIAPVLSGTFESGAKEKSAPETSAGADAASKKLQIFPMAGYNRTDRFYSGGVLKYNMDDKSRFPLGNFRVDGVGSTSAHKVTASLAGSHDSSGWLAHAQWQLNYLSDSEPSLDSHLGQNRLTGQFSAISRGPLPLRFGASLEGGNLQSAPSAVAAVAANSVASSGYGSLKLFLGATGRWQRTDDISMGQSVPFNTFSGSYGVELGSTDAGSSLSWVKHIVDFADDATLPFGDHRWVEIESRLTAGFIQVKSVVPQAARFIGGNQITPFIAGDEWTISSNPFIRSIPVNRLVATTDGFGGTSFISFNSTVSLATWRYPLVPAEVTNAGDFKKNLDFALKSSANFLSLGYLTKDPHYRALVDQLNNVKSALASLKAAVTTAQQGTTPENATLYQQCLKPIGRADVRVAGALRAGGEPQYGNIVALLGGEPNQPPDPNENWLNKIHDACVTQLNAKVNDTAIGSRADELDALHTTMKKDFAAIDRPLADRLAAADMKYPKATLNTLLYQVNLFSLSPVAVFDVAHLGPASSSLGTRYAAGGGLRVALVSHVEFTLGYAANPKRLPNEGKGAMFFSMQLKNLFD